MAMAMATATEEWNWMIGPREYSCFKCGNVICRHDDIVSKVFQARRGRGFLFSHVENVVEGPMVERQLITGRHDVKDIYCSDCGELLGWTYIKAYHELQQYKEGKSVVQKSKIAKHNC